MKFRYHLLAIILLATIAGCKQDVNTTADKYEEVTVVYGLLNQQDNPHYIRIQKGYLIKGNAYVAAGVPDSIYYPDILKVQLLASPSGMKYNLTRIDGNSVGLPKDSGIFVNSPNILYSFTGNLDPNQSYTLQITNTQSGKTISATDSLIHDFNVLTPIPGSHLELSNANPSKITWNTAQNASIYDLTVRFYYMEYSTADNSLLRDTFADIPFLRSLSVDHAASSVARTDFSEATLLSYLTNHLDPSPTIYRKFNQQKAMQFKFAAGGIELGAFLNAKQAQSGITSSTALPIYTNIVGGVGLLSSRYFKEVDSVLLSPNALDSLRYSADAQTLHFK